MKHVHARPAVRRATGLAVAAVLGLTACSGNEPVEADADALPSSITIEAHDYRFDVPAQVAAGAVEVTLTNAGEEPHHAQIARLNDGVTMDDVTAALAEGEAALMPLITFVGGPAPVDPGGEATTVAELAAGGHVLLCFLPDADGVPHLAHGMVQPFEVVDTEDAAAMPETDGDITLSDFRIRLPDGFDGQGAFQVTNGGPQPHEVGFARLADGASAEDALGWFGAPGGPPPFQLTGGIQALSVGEDGIAKLDLDAGEYVAWCLIPDPETGKPHAQLGMVTTFTVD